LFSPVAGSITAVNEALEDQPELLNSDPYGKGWIVKLNVTDSSGIADLMNAAAYAKYCESR
jgi:glycine cleavage system H protein